MCEHDDPALNSVDRRERCMTACGAVSQCVCVDSFKFEVANARRAWASAEARLLAGDIMSREACIPLEEAFERREQTCRPATRVHLAML